MKRLLLTLLLVVSCGNPKEDSSLKYGTYTPGKDILRSWSAFTTIEQSGCQLPMMLYTANGAYLNQQQILFIRDSVVSSVNAWTSTLQANPQWRCKGGVSVT